MSNADCLQRCLLEKALTREASQTLIPAAMDLIQPFYHMAEKGEHRLARYDQFSCASVHQYLSLTTGAEVKRIRFVDEPQVLPKDRAYFPMVEQHLNIQDLGEAVHQIEAAFDHYLWLPLEEMIWQRYDQPAWQKLIENFQIDLRLALLSILAMAVTGDGERQKRMGHALRLMKESIPLGQAPNEDGTWLLLAA
ncbi:hypothetical protein KJ611_01890 [Patescibacteria group bacterium]|nr:hypothetical protein [Patescibacteria group bacterium]MBU1705919.1 hypothetical protein [Patescibacteria group bacterium]